jgi:hypothetical protein
MEYNLTEKQKDILRWIVRKIREGSLEEEFRVYQFAGDESVRISDYKGEDIPQITRGLLDVLVQVGMMNCTPHFHKTNSGRTFEAFRTCVLLGLAYEAVDRNFEAPEVQPPQITVGAIVHSMSGGNVQAVGIAEDAEISQVVNDPDLLQSQVDALTENLVSEVRNSLNVDELTEYLAAVQELKAELLADQVDSSRIKRLVRTIGLLGDIEGTVGLITRVWTFLHPLLLIAAERLG